MTVAGRPLIWKVCTQTKERLHRVERVLELSHIALNKNTVPGDKSAMVPGGIRMGSPAMTSRGLEVKDFEQVGTFVHRGIEIAKHLKQQTGVLTTLSLFCDR
jgi:glycine/serine hydroxymethyltransferase